MSTKVKFVNSDRSTFFVTARQRVDAYFKENNLSTHANGAMWFKALFFLGGYVALYTLIISNQFSTSVMLGMVVLLGMFAAFIGFNVSHDALHGAFSSKAWVNRLLGNSFYLLGANPYVWKVTHNIVHHTYTNIPGHDEDIEIAPGLVRLDADEPLRSWHKYQHFYTIPLYSLASLSWVFRKDYVKFFKKNIGSSHDNSQHPRSEYYKLFISKAVYYLLFLVIPYLVLDLAWYEIALGFLIMHIAEGLVLGLVFQLAHVVEGTDFPVPDQKGNVLNAWAVHQMYTTANFSPRSGLAAFLCGGLNRQIEHHLFPKVCHIHYPAVSAIVKQTALEHGLPYLENETFAGALASHYQVLKKMGTTEVKVNVAKEEFAF
ncbi:acyl-CoA desaturase [Siphonobacter sp. SORGH_AS_0500]|uniref:fatty acid desaturase family protein n=1 Tax=Siphonobacter sp. SORGH_AS_0500 TaxID=1864824 RepID=UPI000CC978CB|nr:acyl-CoA desaturase [Siphonobacter sp. SORGH_AS_0500]PKK36191.1 acyl-CoA desaturase [Siphonobacter sp. SORGH_AS_0500]